MTRPLGKTSRKSTTLSVEKRTAAAKHGRLSKKVDKLNKQLATDPVVDLLPTEILMVTFSSNIDAKEITQMNLDVHPGSTRVTRATAMKIANQITNVDEAIRYKKVKKPFSIQIISKNSTINELDQQGVRPENIITAITTGTENITTTIAPEMENTTTTSTNDPYQKIKAGSKSATTNEIEKQEERTGNTTITLNAGTQKTKTLEMVKATIIKTTDDSREKNKVRNTDATINKEDKQRVRTDNTTTIIPQVKESTTTIITPKMKKLTIITKDDRHEKNISGDKIYQMKQTPININHDNTDNINITEKKHSYTLHSSQEPGPSKHISDREMEGINKAIREADRVERYGKD
ncbi:hypothetical protein ACJMK2_015864 [Sinanodonta woodiana]|uniref:Uncharacterized protein n=1 Tax=Sinanodonta woodiana TaxID=1069815 RepID=A0ABD3UV90_SINWO